MGIDKAVNSTQSLNIKPIKKTFMMKMMGIGGKIDSANNEIKAATGDNKSAKNKASTGVNSANTAASQTDDTNYEVSDGVNQSEQSNTESQDLSTESTEAASSTPEMEAVAAQYAENTENFATMTENATTENETVMAQLQEKFTIMNDAGMQLMENSEESDALIEELQTLQEGGGQEFGTGMAAAGGQSSAYSLNVPTGANNAAPSVKGKKQGGLISPTAGQPAQAQQPAQGSQNNGATGDNAGIARTQAIYARLAEIQTSTTEIEQVITTASEEAISLQQLYEATMVETQDTTAGQVTEAEAQNENAQKVAATFAKIQTIGTGVAIAGGVINGVGKGMITAGLNIKVAGKTVGGIGKFIKGMFGGISITGKAVAGIFPIFTAGPGAGITVAGDTGKVTGTGISKSGKAVEITGGTINKTGKVVAQVGSVVKVTGQAAQTVGSAGTLAVGIATGNIGMMIGGAMSFLTSAVSFLGTAGQFAQAMGASTQGFLGSCSNIVSKIDGALGSMSGGQVSLGTLSNVANSISTNAQNGKSGWETALEVGQTLNIDGNNSIPTNNAGSNGNSDIKNKAKALNISDTEIMGMSDEQINKIITKRQALNKEAKALGLNVENLSLTNEQIQQKINEAKTKKA